MLKNIGYCCINLSLSDNLPKAKQVTTSRTIRLNTFSLEKVSDLAYKNTLDLVSIMEWNVKNKIKLFRVSSNMFPFMDHPTLNYKIDDLKLSSHIKKNLINAADIAKSNHIRLTFHPGPYTCLASPNFDTVAKSILTLNMHNEIAELLGINLINIHVGGTYNDYTSTAERFILIFNSLPAAIKSKLTLENDDCKSGWSIKQLYELIHKRCGIRLVFDFHHHRFHNDNLTDVEGFDIARGTWYNEIPLTHYSESGSDKMPEAHSDYIVNKIPDTNWDHDCEIEAKKKDLALIFYRNKYGIN